MAHASLTRWFPFLAWPRPSRALLRGEFWAGITVGLMLVPQGVAYAQLAGMPLVTGIYASLAPTLVAVLWSSSTRLGVGPTALSSLLIGTSLAVYPAASLIDYVPPGVPTFLIDPQPTRDGGHIRIFATTASLGVPLLAKALGVQSTVQPAD